MSRKLIMEYAHQTLRISECGHGFSSVNRIIGFQPFALDCSFVLCLLVHLTYQYKRSWIFKILPRNITEQNLLFDWQFYAYYVHYFWSIVVHSYVTENQLLTHFNAKWHILKSKNVKGFLESQSTMLDSNWETVLPHKFLFNIYES